MRLTVTGAATYNNSWVSLGEFQIYGQENDPNEDDTWFGYPVEDGWTHVGANFLGWIYVGADPWILVNATNSWYYLDGADITDGGVWAYANNGWGSSWDDIFPWIYSWDLETWIYVDGDGSSPSAWGYIKNSGN